MKYFGILALALALTGCKEDRFNVTCPDGTSYKDVYISTYKEPQVLIYENRNGKKLASVSPNCTAVFVRQAGQ